MSAASGLTIGAVVTALKDEFHDVSISKIRFLEAEGLVTPRRTASGYRVFGPQEVSRLRYVLRAQRDRFLPLRVIRDELDAIDRGVLAPDDAVAVGGVPVAGAATGGVAVGQAHVPVGVPGVVELTRRPRMILRRSELAERAGLDPAQIDSLAAYGLIRRDADGHYDEDDLTVAVAAASLVRFGIEPRHLRPFRSAADREATLIEHAVVQDEGGAADAVGPGGDGPTATDAAAEVARQCLALHVALVRQSLRRQ